MEADETGRTHLRPVPPPGTENEATAREPETQHWESGIPGLTPPSEVSRSGAFVTDVIVDLGYAPRERVDAVVAEARAARRQPERMLVEQGAIDADQLSRAVAERYGLDHLNLGVFRVDMAAANLISETVARLVYNHFHEN